MSVVERECVEKWSSVGFFDCASEQRTVQIYYADSSEWKAQALFDKGLSLVCEDRRKKVEACRFLDDRCRSLAAGLLIRYACMIRGMDYGTLSFSQSEHGKPMVEGLQYNVSHSGCYAVLAAGDVPVGIDVERLTGRFSGERGARRLEGIVRKTFDAAEKALFEQYMAKDGLSEEALRFVAEVWTRKESYAKECGAGLGMDFSGIHTQETDGFSTFALPGDYMVSIFSKKPVKIAIPVCVPAEEMLR